MNSVTTSDGNPNPGPQDYRVPVAGTKDTVPMPTVRQIYQSATNVANSGPVTDHATQHGE
jgi:hypothetical protein